MKNLLYEVEIKTEDQLRKRIGDAANQIRNNLEMLNSVYENWYRCGVLKCVFINAKGRHMIIYYKIIFLI
jgi:hypothetical protein